MGKFIHRLMNLRGVMNRLDGIQAYAGLVAVAWNINIFREYVQTVVQHIAAVGMGEWKCGLHHVPLKER